MAPRHLRSSDDHIGAGVAPELERSADNLVLAAIGQRHDPSARRGRRLSRSAGLFSARRHQVLELHRRDVLGAAALPLVYEEKVDACEGDLVTVQQRLRQRPEHHAIDLDIAAIGQLADRDRLIGGGSQNSMAEGNSGACETEMTVGPGSDEHFARRDHMPLPAVLDKRH
jgi:hypothetical protein